jgi:zinc protease
VVVIDQPEATQSQVALASRSISAVNPQALALSTANVALGGFFTSRLNMQLREVRGWSYGISSSAGFNKKTGTVQVRGSVKAQHTVDSVRDIEDVVQRFATGDITDAELAQAKEGIVRQLPSALETNDAVASTFVTLTLLGRPLDWYATLPDRLTALSREEVARAAQEHLDPARWPVVVVGPRSDLEGLAALKLGPVVDRTAEATGGPSHAGTPVPAAR